MHEFFVNIGYAILNFFRNVKTDNILKSLSIMGIGMVGIFLVTGIIVLAVYLLNKISNSDGKTKNKKNDDWGNEFIKINEKDKTKKKKNNKPALRFAPQGGVFVIYFAT